MGTDKRKSTKKNIARRLKRQGRQIDKLGQRIDTICIALRGITTDLNRIEATVAQIRKELLSINSMC